LLLVGVAALDVTERRSVFKPTLSPTQNACTEILIGLLMHFLMTVLVGDAPRSLSHAVQCRDADLAAPSCSRGKYV
jgi:hypothetical protein